MSTVKNFNVGGVNYPVQDTKATPFLSSEDEATLLSDGTYRGDEIASNTIFTKPDGTINKFTKTPIGPSWVSSSWPGSNRLSASNGDVVMYCTATNQLRYVNVSTDGGSTWTQRDATGGTTSNQGGGLCYHKGAWYFKNRYTMRYSTDNGVTWADMTAGWAGTAYDTMQGGYLLSNGDILLDLTSGNPKYYDEVNDTWVACTMATSSWWYAGTTDPITKKIYLSSPYSIVCKSTDGKTFTSMTKPDNTSQTCYIAAYNGLLVYANASNSFYSTDDGATWINTGFGGSDGVRVENGVFLLYNESNGNAVSTDGYTWSPVSGGVARPISVIPYKNNFYVGSYSLPTTLQYTYALTPQNYTTSEVDTALASKQDTLTAGTGISISEGIVRDYTVVGTHVSVTNEGIASGFYATSNYVGNSYIKSPSTLPSYSLLYFEIEFKMPSTLFSTDEPLIIMENNISDLFISGQNRTIATWNGSNYVGGSTLLSAGQTYKLRGTETNGTLVIEMLVNGSWVEQIRTSYTPFKNGYNVALGTMVSYYPSFEGSIDLSKTFIKINGADWWRPFVIQPSVISTTDSVAYEAGDDIDITYRSAGQENFTKLGSPTITNKVVSNLSEVNQLTIPALTDGPCSTFEVTSVITRTASVDYECCFSSSNAQLFKYTSGTSFGSLVSGVGDQVTSGRNSVNTTYWVKAVLSASNYKCYCYPFTEGSEPPASLSSWNLCCTITDSAALTYLRNMFSELVYVTGNSDPRYAVQYWHGLMNLSYTSIYIDGELKWTPYTTEANVISNTGDYLVGTTAPTTATAGSVGQRYLNKTDNSSYVLTGYTAGQKNYTTSGTVAVNDYGVALFAYGGQVIPNQTWSYSGSPWAIEMKFTTPISYTSDNGRCLFRWGYTDCMIFLNSAGYIVACGWSQGSQPRASVSLNTTYWLKVEYDGTNINLYLSTTSTFPTTPSASSSSPAYWPGNNIATCIGGKNGDETYTGSIDLSSVKWYSNGVLVYSALTKDQYTWTKLQNRLTEGTGIAIGSDDTVSLTTPYEVVQTLPGSPTSGKIYFVTGS